MSVLGITIDEACVRLLAAGTSKETALDALVDAAAHIASLPDVEALRQAVHAREQARSTGIGGGVAIPHVDFAGIGQPRVTVGVSPSGIDFDAMDGEPVHLIVFFVMPVDANRLYLELLAQRMVVLKAPSFVARLKACTDASGVAAILNESGA